jgi:mono/diheme cytochrome c family protein
MFRPIAWWNAPAPRWRGRAQFRPDVVGQYTIKVAIVTLGSGSTNLSRTITAGTYLGAATCALCHSGGLIASNTYTPWSLTAHAGAFHPGD